METELTFDLSDVEGSIVFGDVFEAHKLWIDRLHWRFQDELGNYITRIQLRSDPDTWRTQFNEWNQPLNQEDVDDLANDMLNGEF